MSDSIHLAQYYPGTSLIHELDPRIKMTVLMLFMVVAFSISDPIGILAIGIFCVIAVTGSRVPWRLMLRGSRAVAVLIVITILVHLFGSNGEVLFRLGSMAATKQGLQGGLLMSVRLRIVVWTTSLLSLTTAPDRLSESLENMLAPLKLLRVPVHELAMMMSVALRFIPTMTYEAEKIIKAQKARAAPFGSKNPWLRFKSYLSILVPLFVVSIKRADELAIAMEARCYRGSHGRTQLNRWQISALDWVILIISIIIMAFIVVISR